MELDAVAVLGHPVDGLAQPLELPPGEGERPHVDHRLVADVYLSHPARAVDGQPFLARAQYRDGPAVLVGEAPEGAPDRLALGDRADGIG